MTDLVYDEIIGWYDANEAYCTVDECHKPAVTFEVQGTVNIDIDEDGMCFMTYAVCEEHSPYKEI